MQKPRLSEADFIREARDLNTDVPAIKAVTKVEAPRGGFQDDGQVSILFERHKFSEYTQGRFDRSHPDLSNPTPGGYGTFSAQHGRLQRAVVLDRNAALMATSWGLFQILGSNYREAGFKSLQEFINAMISGESAQLSAFVDFVKSNPRRWNALKSHDWATFAKLYNGKNYKINQYDVKLADAYREFGGGS